MINKKEPFIIGLGDIIVLILSLWMALYLRLGNGLDMQMWNNHLVPFSFIFLYSIVVFYVAGLYARHAVVLRKTALTILNSQIINALIAALIFYFTPAVSNIIAVSPKTILVIYTLVSIVLLSLWRIFVFPLISSRKKYQAIIIGKGEELRELLSHVDSSSKSLIKCVLSIDLEQIPVEEIRQKIVSKLESSKIDYVILDMYDEKVKPFLADLYSTIFTKVQYVNFYNFYEELFDKIPLSRLRYSWIMERMSFSDVRFYDFIKRVGDIILSIPVAIVFLILFPFVYIAIKLDDKGDVFISQKRIGKDNKLIYIYKYRSMTQNDGGVWLPENDNKVTRVGYFLRKSRIDELPQVLSVLKGDMSFVGPRPDIIDLGNRLAKDIPYYTIRNVIKPGLSGWAQVSQEKPPQSVEETKIRLSYDLYYIQNRSLGLDIKIVLRTIKTLLSRVGM
ncbi:MAG: exopolysaccharide biosynthesis polyprenyl glycosylphosphotransferase [bacterium]